MTFYEELQKHLTTKQYVLIQNDNGNYCVFSHITDYNGNYRISGWRRTKEGAMTHIGDDYSYTPQEVNEHAEAYKWKILDVFSIPEGKFKKGDIVVVDKNAKELSEEAGIDWHTKKEAMVSKECEIRYVFNYTYYVYTPDKSDFFMLPHSALSYPLDEDSTELTSEEVIEEINKLLNKLTNNNK